MTDDRMHEMMDDSQRHVRRRTFKRTLLVMLGIVVLIVLMFAFMLFGPSVPIVVSPKTTFITEPRDAYGNIDYFEALRREQKQGVTVDNNAAVLLWQAWGRMDLGPDDIEPHFRELGIPIPPEDGEYLISIGDKDFLEEGIEWLRKHRTLRGDRDPEDEFENKTMFEELVSEAMSHAWREENYPPLANLLKKNQKPIDLIFEATKRPRMYAPMLRPPSGDDSSGGMLIGLLLHTAQNTRAAARALCLRSMGHLGEGRIEEAWGDAFACHRLARLAGEGPTLVDQLIAIAIDGLAARLDAVILDRPLTKEQVDQMRNDLASLGPCSDMARSLDRSERLVFLDMVTYMSRGQEAEDFGGFEGLEIAGHFSIDWNVPLEMANEAYDGIVAAMEVPRFAERERALELQEAKFQKMVDSDDAPKKLLRSLFSRQARSELVGEIFAALMLPATTAASHAEDRANIHLALTRVAVEIAAYRTEHGAYPEKLEDLGKEVFAKLPLDFFVEKPFRYERRGEGYLLYSVGRNQTDNGGTSEIDETVNGEYVDEEEASNLDYTNDDDRVLRLPLRPLEIPKPAIEDEEGL